MPANGLEDARRRAGEGICRSPAPTASTSPATAKIEGATVLVSSPEVPNPQSVRYAWDYNPDANLINAPGAAGVALSDGRERRAGALNQAAKKSSLKGEGTRAKGEFALSLPHRRVLPEHRQQICTSSRGLEVAADDVLVADRLAVHLRVLIEILAQRRTRQGDAGEDSAGA